MKFTSQRAHFLGDTPGLLHAQEHHEDLGRPLAGTLGSALSHRRHRGPSHKGAREDWGKGMSSTFSM